MRRTLGAIIVVVLFGAKKLPELASALGKPMKEFKNGIAGIPGLPVLPRSARDGVDDRGAARKRDGA
jgi:TatA/E family protein of Tat protein translocase